MKISPVSNTQFKTREFGTIENLIKKDKSVVIVSTEIEQKINKYMQELAEKRRIEEYDAMQTAKKMILNI